MISIVLVEPETPGNIGSIARVMKNFGLERLVLVNPKCSHLDGEAIGRAMHSVNILKKIVVVGDFASIRKNFGTLVATTAALGTSTNVARLPLLPEQLAAKYSELRKGKTALVFGREGTGLTNAELLKCDFVVTIATSTKYRTLNISHAVAIILYELSKKSRMKKIVTGFAPATSREKEVIMKIIDDMLGKMAFHFDSQRLTQKKIWRRLIGKAMLSRREAFAVIGFLKKAGKLK